MLANVCESITGNACGIPTFDPALATGTEGARQLWQAHPTSAPVETAIIAGTVSCPTVLGAFVPAEAQSMAGLMPAIRESSGSKLVQPRHHMVTRQLAMPSARQIGEMRRRLSTILL